jgi:L-2-hydroxyglutarate oxidase LhgO
VPELQREDLHRGPSGVRAQLVGPAGELVDDFAVHETDRAVHVLNAPSPAATASLAIGRMVAERALARLE